MRHLNCLNKCEGPNRGLRRIYFSINDALLPQGLIRSHSFRLKTLREEEAVFRAGKVSSIRAKFSRRSPDGASDDYLEADRNV